MIDILRILETYGIEHRVTRTGWAEVQCPYCDDSKFHGGFSTIYNSYHCWKCGNHSIFYTLKLILNVSNSELSEIAERYVTRISLLKSRKENAPKVTEILLPGSKLERIHKNYLLKRGFDPEFLESKYGLRGTGPVDGDWSLRIIIPIFVDGKVVSFQGRAICKGIERYKTLEKDKSIVSAKETLYNIDNCHLKNVVVVEGPFDVMRLGDNVVGTLGTEMTQFQK